MGLQVLASAGGGGLPQDVSLATAATLLLGSRVVADAADRFTITADGTEKWGGGAGATDVTLARSGVGVLALTGGLTASADLSARLAAATQVKIGAFGPAAEAAITLGSAADASWYRSASAVLRTPGAILVDGDVKAQNTLTTQVAMGAQGPAAEPGLSFTATPNARLYWLSPYLRSNGRFGGNSDATFQIGNTGQIGIASNSITPIITWGSGGGSTSVVRVGGNVLGIDLSTTGMTAPSDLVGVGLMLRNVTTAPTVAPVNAGCLFMDAGALKYIGTAGTVTTVAPA